MASTGQTINRTGDFWPAGVTAKTLVEKVEFTGATAGVTLTPKIPAGSIVIASELRLATAITAATAVKVGLGTASDPDKYALTSNLTAQTVGPAFENQWGASLAAEETIGVYACDTSGAAAGTIGAAGQYVYVRVSYITAESLLKDLP